MAVRIQESIIFRNVEPFIAVGANAGKMQQIITTRDVIKMNKLIILTAALLFTGSAMAAAPVIYPAKGQSPDQQSKDTSECSSWAVQNSGYDPANPPAAPVPQAAPAPSGPNGSRLRGAAAGAIVSEIAGGDNGKGAVTGAVMGGMRSRRKQAAAAQNVQASNAQQQQAAADQQQAGQASFNKALSACLEGKGYSVK